MGSLFWTLMFVLLACEVYSVLPVEQKSAEKPVIPYRTGILHVHSQFSEHGSNLREVARVAKQAGIDFVVVTDHASSQARAAHLETSYDGVDVFVEMEASTPGGECLTFYSQTPSRDLPDDDVNRLAWEHYLGKDVPGLFNIVAHPSDLRKPWNRLDRFAEGFELLNFNSARSRELADTTLDFLLTLGVAPFNNFLAALRFFQIYPKDFLAWDAMNSVSPGHFAVLGHDNSDQLDLGFGPAIPWPAPLATFRLASNVIFVPDPLPADFEQRKAAIYHALSEGRSAIVFQAIYPFAGNDARVECTAGGQAQTYRPGDRFTAAAGCELVVDTPHSFPFRRVVRVLKDGEKIAEKMGTDPEVRVPVVGPGVYRAEVWLKKPSLLHVMLGHEVPYVIYNPIYAK